MRNVNMSTEGTKLETYVKDAIRTESQVEEVRVNYQLFLSVMTMFIASGNMLDQVKKNVFYNKPFNEDDLVAGFGHIVAALDDLKRYVTSKEEHKEANVALEVNPRLFHAIIGIATEATELLEALNDPSGEIDTVNLIEELGDLNWYEAIACDAMNVSLEDVLTRNIEKLQARFPDKYNDQNAVKRDLEKERNILEKGKTNELS